MGSRNLPCSRSRSESTEHIVCNWEWLKLFVIYFLLIISSQAPMSVAAVASQYKRALSQVAGALAAKVTHSLHIVFA